MNSKEYYAKMLAEFVKANQEFVSRWQHADLSYTVELLKAIIPYIGKCFKSSDGKTYVHFRNIVFNAPSNLSGTIYVCRQCIDDKDIIMSNYMPAAIAMSSVIDYKECSRDEFNRALKVAIEYQTAGIPYVDMQTPLRLLEQYNELWNNLMTAIQNEQ